MTSYKEDIHHPWQQGPTELIAHAIEHMHKGTDFDNRIAFLLFDVGVETLFKTYLMLPDEETGAKTKFSKRKDAVNGQLHSFEDEKKNPKKDLKFHDLIIGIRDAIPEINNKFNLVDVEYFHNIRNTLYHDSNGKTIEIGHLKSYSSVAVNLLNYLLGVNLEDLLHAPEIQAKVAEAIKQEWKVVSDKKETLKSCRLRLTEAARCAVEILAPSVTTTNFYRIMANHYNESKEKASNYFVEVVKQSFSEQATIDLIIEMPLLSIERILSDHNYLNLHILDCMLGTERALGIYEVTSHDPEKFITGYDNIYNENGDLIEEIPYDYKKHINDLVNHLDGSIRQINTILKKVNDFIERQ